MTNRTGAALLIAAMTFGSGVALRTAADVTRREKQPTVLADRRLDELPEFITTQTRNGTDTNGRFTERSILTAGGLSCQVMTYAYNFPGPSTCEVNQPVPNPGRFSSLSSPSGIPFPPFTTSESEIL